jgi:hypothetical protein
MIAAFLLIVSHATLFKQSASPGTASRLLLLGSMGFSNHGHLAF